MDQSTGLGFVGDATVAVVDAKLAAGRGREFSASHQVDLQNKQIDESIARDGDFRLPIDHRPQQSLRTDGIEIATMDTPIPESNKGYRLLAKMGWSAGKGLGRNESGIVDPIRGSETSGLRFGLGKAEEDSIYTAEENITRVKLASEAQLEETEEEAQARMVKAEQQEKIKEEVKEELSTFYCKLCNKQYTKAMELEVHLSSYDHHHKKRLIEMKQMTSERTKDDRAKREKKRLEKEMAQMNEQVRKAQEQQQQGQQPGAPPLPSQPPPPFPPGPSDEASAAPAPAPTPAAVPENRKAMAFSFGGGAPSGTKAAPAARGGMVRGRGGGRLVMGASGAGRVPGGRGQQSKPKPGLAAFALDSDSDD